jgi:hypothetical protein
LADLRILGQPCGAAGSGRGPHGAQGEDFNLIQPLNQARARAAAQRAQESFYDPEGTSNADVIVALRSTAAL